MFHSQNMKSAIHRKPVQVDTTDTETSENDGSESEEYEEKGEIQVCDDYYTVASDNDHPNDIHTGDVSVENDKINEPDKNIDASIFRKNYLEIANLTLVCTDSVEIKVHKEVLICRTEYFNTMLLSDNWREEETVAFNGASHMAYAWVIN